MALSTKRSEYLAITGLVSSVIFFLVTLLLGRWSGFFAVYTISWLIGSSILIWLVLFLQFHLINLAEQEKLDMGLMEKGRQGSTIFQTKAEQAGMLAVAQRRLAMFEKWFLPIFSALIAIYQAGIGLYLVRALTASFQPAPKEPLICAASLVAVAFVCLLISRLATGLALSQNLWRPLKAGGSSFVAVAVLSFFLFIGLLFAHFGYNIIVEVLNWIVPVLLIILGAETALNVVFDIYRPRIKGQYNRSAFDSRLLGIINEPGGIIHTAASAIDYQFGFKVSQTWFYKLLEKAIVPLVLFAAAALYLSSCIVVINPDEEAVLERFGNPVKDSSGVKIIKPGILFKWPWPIDIAYKYPAYRVMELAIGYVPNIDPKTGQPERSPKLWGRTHYKEEYHLLVASGQRSGKIEAGAVPVSLVIAAVPVQYRVKDLYSFLYNYGKYQKSDGSEGYASEKMLEAICYQQLTSFAASARIEVDTSEDLAHSLLGAGRVEAKKILTENIQAAADKAGLGIEVVFLGMQGIHPPPEVAADYQKVIGAVQQKQALILQADAEKNRTLSTLAGSLEDSDRLYKLAAQYQAVKEKQEDAKTKELAERLDEAFEQAKGDIFATLRSANSYAYQKAVIARATGERFAGQIQAYRAAPQIFKHEQRLTAIQDGLKGIRKFVIVADENQFQVQEIDVTDKFIPGLTDAFGTEGSSSQ